MRRIAVTIKRIKNESAHHDKTPPIRSQRASAPPTPSVHPRRDARRGRGGGGVGGQRAKNATVSPASLARKTQLDPLASAIKQYAHPRNRVTRGTSDLLRSGTQSEHRINSLEGPKNEALARSET